jgi:VIT1/CCC1 family predicted Fe2+/Mn2+ transporter
MTGALSMAAGEYVWVSSQRDPEAADLRLEEPELRADPDEELRELAAIYVRRVCAGTAIVARAAISHSWLSPPRRSGR